MSPIAVFLMAFAPSIGAFLRNALPGHYLAEDAKDIFRLNVGRPWHLRAGGGATLNELVAPGPATFRSNSAGDHIFRRSRSRYCCLVGF